MADTRDNTIEVEVVYALPRTQTVLQVRVACGTTIMQAIVESRILQRHPEIDLAAAPVGIFGRRRPLSALPSDGDRIEIYRPLQADPNRRAVGARDGESRVDTAELYVIAAFT